MVTTCPQFTELDNEITQDFAECLQENIEQIEACIALLDNSKDPELVHRLFRDIHSLKGNCRMVFLDPLVETIHALEEIVSDMRQGQRTYLPMYGEFIFAIVIRIRDMINTLISDGQVEGTPQATMLKVIEDVRGCTAGQDLKALDKAMDQLVGAKKSSTEEEKPGSIALSLEHQDNPDLAFFRKLALQLDDLGIYKQGRTDSILELCLSTNKDLEEPIDTDQLTAAVYLHDIGMSLVSPDILNKPSKLSDQEFRTIRGHIEMGSEFLSRMEGWTEAATMVAQHHERYDGKGYPKNLANEQIHRGAMLIALADTFYAVTNERADRSYK
ncbi:hypothetical protein A3766_16365, partial [Oleiphilus sp. HI0132]